MRHGIALFKKLAHLEDTKKYALVHQNKLLVKCVQSGAALSVELDKRLREEFQKG